MKVFLTHAAATLAATPKFHDTFLNYLHGLETREAAEAAFDAVGPLNRDQLGAWFDYLRLPIDDLDKTFQEIGTGVGGVSFANLDSEMHERLSVKGAVPKFTCDR